MENNTIICNAIIKNINLGYNLNYNSDILTLEIELQTEMGDCIFGSDKVLDDNKLDSTGKIIGRKVSDRMQVIIDLIKTIKVDYFHQLKGQHVKVKWVYKTDKSKPKCFIGHFLENNWIEI